MNRPAPLEVVFLTNFSDSCFRAIPSIAQMVDDFSVHLTILHAYDPKRRQRAESEAWLRSFFPEADRYLRAKRVVMAGPPVEALQRLKNSQQIDMVLCPGSDALGLPRLGHRPFRARVVHEYGLPVWTIGRHVDPARLGRPARNVACWMAFGSAETAHVKLAAEYAVSVGAKLHLLQTLPDIHEGMILPSLYGHPLQAGEIEEAYCKLLHRYPLQPLIHIHGGNGRKTRAALAKEHDADVLFTSVARSPLTDWAYSDFDAIDHCPCPVICIGQGSAPPVWNLERGYGRAAHAVPTAVPRAIA